MRRCPRSILVIGWMFIIAGVVGLAYHSGEFQSQRPFERDFLWVCAVRLLAVLCGAFLLRGSNWARWGLVVWLAYHVILSALHSTFELLIHGLLAAGVVYFLFRPPAAAYFRREARPGP